MTEITNSYNVCYVIHYLCKYIGSYIFPQLTKEILQYKARSLFTLDFARMFYKKCKN